MGLFDWLKKEKIIESEDVSEPKQIDYHPLIEVAKIITQNHGEAVEVIRLLVENPQKFEELHYDWVQAMGLSPAHHPDILAAYWLTGYDSPHDFGAYIDWKEATEDILWNLEPSIKKKNYPLDLSDITFTGEEFTDEALENIKQFLEDKGFTLICWDTDSDSYHLFMVELTEVNQLVALGQKMEVRFYNKFT
ncbi:hypothetical protein JZO70_07435 [Enterococcus sp. 669A]|uniref:DUF6630 domain-containing protein n=1 Tax=Candidatus Enterococcus moelleringii TaxID=2815325 RepID=A0ABS3L8Q4_9ENTE|nr:hypothetical protein [Enterococcus sp. 669A]MBO1305987.1 hypothetical protein [Enterococcus sp. 669A]